MPPGTTNETKQAEAGWGTMRRFLPYLWPAGEGASTARVRIA